MPPLTPRELLMSLVELSAAFTARSISQTWGRLYDHFEHLKNTSYRRMAYNEGATILDKVEEMGDLAELLAVAQGFLKLPALPDTKKAPRQGSLIDEGDNT